MLIVPNIKPARILLSAINGYGYYYLKALRDEVPESDAFVAGVVDPEAKKSNHFFWLSEENIPVFDRIEDYFQSGYSADLTVISSPPQFHVSQAVIAINHGSQVLVDKPVGVTVDSVNELISVKDKTGLSVEVGYQWSFSNAIQNLKQDILTGVYGDPVRFKSICLWPRDNNYYSRNNWAGRVEDPDGHEVFDSPANNACAHFLHNLLFLLGDQMSTSAFPKSIECEKYRAYSIENYDTISLKIRTERDVDVLFYASHVTELERNPEFVLEFEKGEVKFGGDNKFILGRNEKGIIINYGSPDEHQFKKLFDAIKRVREPGPATCPPEAALAHTICIEQIQNSENQTSNFPEDLVNTTENRKWVKGLNEKMDEVYNENVLLSDV